MMHINRLSKHNQFRLAVFLLTVFLVSFFFTSLTPLLADDFNYSFSWGDGKRIDNFIMVYQSMSVHRIWQHGRIVASGLASVFLMWPKWIFNIANAILTTVFFTMLVHHFRRTGSKDPIIASASVSAFYWICMPCFGQVFLWLVGSCNYFWGAALAWIVIEAERSLNQSIKKRIITPLLLPLAFLAGAWSEHISFSAIVIQFLFILRRHARKNGFPVCEWMVLVSTALGYAYLMFAPSMLGSKLLKRAQDAISEHKQQAAALFTRFWWVLPVLILLGITIGCFVKRIPERKQRISILSSVACLFSIAISAGFAVFEMIKGGFYGLLSSVPVCFFLLLFAFFFGIREAVLQDADENVVIDAMILGFGGLAALIPFAFAMYVPARGFCAPVIFVGIATAKLFSFLKSEKRKVIAGGLAVCFCVCFCVGLADNLELHNAAKRRSEEIEIALAGDGILFTEPYPVKTRFNAQYGLEDIKQGESWPRDQIAEYYGLKKINVLGNHS